ncbi:MAG: hypothetical protein D6690_13575 [Nitrospirae bacterium]|nr:MAG: hypothetical protein D6690_13575 [Nitrospirota bacterium]
MVHIYEDVKRRIALGRPTAALSFDRNMGAYFQAYQRGGIMYHDSLDAAFEIHGAIYAQYQRMRGRSSLGYLVSDESPPRPARVVGRVSSVAGLFIGRPEPVRFPSKIKCIWITSISVNRVSWDSRPERRARCPEGRSKSFKAGGCITAPASPRHMKSTAPF